MAVVVLVIVIVVFYFFVLFLCGEGVTNEEEGYRVQPGDSQRRYVGS